MAKVNLSALVVIKSTVPVGCVEQVVKTFGCKRLLISPEFPREEMALYDNLHPSRIVVGLPKKGEATKADAELFANTCLAVRVSYFNELDTYCEPSGLDISQISMACAPITALAIITITPLLATLVTAGLRTPSNWWQTSAISRNGSLLLSVGPTAPT